MKKWFISAVRRHETFGIVVTGIIVVGGPITGLFLTFMTITAGEKSEASMKAYVDSQVKAVDTRVDRTENSLAEMMTTLNRIDERVYKLYTGKGAFHGRETRD